MRNRKLLLLALMSVAALTLAGCKGKDSGKTATEETTAASAESETASADDTTLKLFDFKAADYVKLGEYKGAEINYTKAEITDDDVQWAVSDLIYEYTEYNEISDRNVQAGDYINIDFTGTIDGEEFEGGTESGYEFTLGEGEFLDDFENNVIGKTVGEEFTFTITFPEDYDDIVGGKEAEFTVIVNAIYEVVEPEYTDEFVAENTEYNNIKEYEEALREELLLTAEEENYYAASEEALHTVIDASTVSGYPQELYDACYSESEVTYQSYADMYGVGMEEFLVDYMGVANLDEVAESWVNEILVTMAITEAEGDVLTEEGYAEEALLLAESYGYETLEEYEADYGKFNVITYVLYDRALNTIFANGEVSEAASTDGVEEAE